MSEFLVTRLMPAGTALSLLALSSVAARDPHARSVRLIDPWTRPTPPADPAGAGYLTIVNDSAMPDRLLGGTSRAVREIQVHKMQLIEASCGCAP